MSDKWESVNSRWEIRGRGALAREMAERVAGRRLRAGEALELVAAMLECALLTWTLPDPGERRPDPVVERDGYRCAVPGCTSRRSLHDHHLRFRSAGGSDATGNRLTLCAFHHQRCLHVGFLGIRGRAPDGLVFELGLRPDAPPLVRYRSGDIEVPRAGSARSQGFYSAAQLRYPAPAPENPVDYSPQCPRKKSA